MRIDKTYLFKVKDYMELPRPRKRLTDIDGSRLPLILLNSGEG